MQFLSNKLWSAVRKREPGTPSALDADIVATLGQTKLWAVREVDYRNGTLELSGWVVPSPMTENLEISVNGLLCDETQYPVPYEAGEGKFLALIGSRSIGFSARLQISRSELFPDGFARFEANRSTVTSLGWYADAAFYRNPEVAMPVPSAESIFRVLGTTSVLGYEMSGFTQFMRIRSLLQERYGRPLDSFQNVLEWGCGCGRITRHLANAGIASLMGIDIDPDNLDWCEKNIPTAGFEQVALAPPTRFPAESFDLIIGISVFTHLKEQIQLDWLEELRRICAIGGIVLVSIHGWAALLKFAGKIEVVRETETQGFQVLGQNSQLNEVITDLDYYVNSAHAHWYVRKNWSKHFHVVDILASSFSHQDLVVLQRMR